MALLSIKHLSKSFNDRSVLNDVSIDIEKGDIFGILGLSGAGKSTLVRCINGLEFFDEGEIYLNNELLSSSSKKISKTNKRKIGMIFQNFNLLQQRDVLGNVELGLEFIKDPHKKDKAIEAIKKVGLEDKMHFYPAQLSGGQRQRVAIARALALEPEIILSDEATSALDPETTSSILSLLETLNKEYGLTIIMISHQLETIEQICNKVAILDKGKIVENGKINEVFFSPKADITKSLIYANSAKTLQKQGKMFRLIFDGNTEEPVMARLIQHCNIDLSIMFAETRIIDGKAYGQLIVKAPEKENDLAYLNEFLKQQNVRFEEVK